MSSARSRNKFCRSLDNSSTSPSNNAAYFNRWSEVVPSKTALTFAALWDPEEGMVTFSGAALLDSESSSATPPHPDVFDDDDDSQLISVDRENSATLAAFQDAFKAFVHRTPRSSEENLKAKAGQGASRYLHSRASSTFDGLDIYSHDIQLKRKKSLQLSSMESLDVESSLRTPSALGGLQFGSDSMLDSYRSSSGSDSSSGSRPAHLKSRFSTTTTSTSNYVDVRSSALQSLRLSETSPTLAWARPTECASPADSWPYLPHRRLLRKRRPMDGDAIPTTASSLPSTPSKIALRPWMVPCPSSPSSSTTAFSTRAASVSAVERRGRFPRRIGSTITSVPTPAPTPPNTPSKSPRFRLPFAFRLKRKSRRPSPDSDGWVCIEVAPMLRQHFVPNMNED